MRKLLLFVLAGCGLGITGSSSGGGDNLPASGGGPYKRLEPDFATPAEEPFVIESRGDDYADPDCKVRDGGGWRCWFTYLPQGGAHTEIGYAEIGDLHQLPEVAPMKAFGRGDADVGKPALVDGPSGTTLLYHDVDGDIEMATSLDGGKGFTDDAAVGLSPASAPTLALVDGTYHLYFVRDGEIWHATSAHGDNFDIDPAPIVAGDDPYVYVTTSDAGRHHWGLFYTVPVAQQPNAPDAGPEGVDTEVHYLASFDGETWESPPGTKPVLASPAAGPCVVPDGTSTVLFFAQETQRLHLGVAAAVP